MPFPKSSEIVSSVEIRTKRTCIPMTSCHQSYQSQKLQSASELWKLLYYISRTSYSRISCKCIQKKQFVSQLFKLVSVSLFLVTRTAHSWYTVENCFDSRGQLLGCLTIEKDHQDGLNQQLHRKPVVPLGMMNKGTKEATEKVLLYRKSAPTVASFGKMKLNEMEKKGDGGQSRGWKHREGTQRLTIDMVMKA